MKKSQLYILSLLLITLFSFVFNDVQAKKKRCKRKKAKTTQIAATDSTTRVVRAPGVPNQREHDSLKAAKMKEKLQSSALVVSFISMSSGIDIKSAQELEAFILSYNKEHKCDMTYEKKPWGREGERDYCIIASNKVCLDDFAKILKTKFNGNRLIFVKENTPCKK